MSKEMREILDCERAEGIAEGMAKGIEKGMEKGKKEGMIGVLVGMVKRGILELSVAAKELGMSESQFKKLVNG